MDSLPAQAGHKHQGGMLCQLCMTSCIWHDVNLHTTWQGQRYTAKTKWQQTFCVSTSNVDLWWRQVLQSTIPHLAVGAINEIVGLA